MRRKKHKQTRRATNYYRINYGFHEPYKVLLDGNFIHATKALNLSDLNTQLPKLLGGTCKLYTTKCVTGELRSLGPQFAGAAAAARSYLLHKCDHVSCGGGGKQQQDKKKTPKKQEAKKKKGGADEDREDAEADEHEGEERQVESEDQEEGEEAAGGGSGAGRGKTSAADCIQAVIGRCNEQHWFVATQDVTLRRQLGQIPGCPLVFATVNGIHLETPSEVTKQKAKEAEAATRSLGKHERAAEPMLREDQLAALRKEQLQQQQKRQKALLTTGSGGGGGGGAVPAATTSARFRRNKAKGPNPLAIKRKINKPAEQPHHQFQQKERGKKVMNQAEAPQDAGGSGGVSEADGQQAALAAAAKRRRKRPKQAGAAAAQGRAGPGGRQADEDD